MTVATTNTYELNIGSIAKLAYRKAGLLNAYQGVPAEMMNAAVDALTLIVNGSQAKGLFARVIEFFPVSLLTGVSSYTLPNTILDVIGDGMFFPVGQTYLSGTGGIPVAIMQRDEWTNLTDKSSQSRPTRYYPHRTGETVELRLWPPPSVSENGATVTFQTHRYRMDVRDTTKVADYERYWSQYLVFALAKELARENSMPTEKVLDLAREAKEALDECKSMAKQRGPEQFTFECRTGWSGR